MMERKVFAKKQAGFDFFRGMHREKAEKMWREAADDAQMYINAPEKLGGEPEIASAIYCAAVICLDMLGETNERNRCLADWAAEHPGDPQVERQRQILIQKHGSSVIPPARERQPSSPASSPPAQLTSQVAATPGVRVNELARELAIKAQQILDVLPEFGCMEKKTYSSRISDEIAERIRLHFGVSS